jgi:TetR/AcrR family acrAB operon transcriptional repressor
MCDFRRQRQANALECNDRIGIALKNAVRKGQLPATLDSVRASISLHAYIDGMLGQWLLIPESYSLSKHAEQWVESGLDMLRLSPALRN